MYLNRNTRARLIVMILMYLTAGLLNYLDYRYQSVLPLRLEPIATALFYFIAIMAIVQMQENIINDRARAFLIATIVILIIWQALSALEESAIFETSTLGRYAWYLYYVPIPFVPNLVYMASLHFSLREHEKAVPSRYWTFAISAAAFLMVITNDRHQLAFKFPQGVDNFYYFTILSYGYYLVMLWVMILVFSIARNVISSIKIERIRKHRYIASISIFVILTYFLWYVLWNSGIKIAPWFAHTYQEPEMWMGIMLLAIELAIRVGMIKSNLNYRQLYQASTISASIVDSHGEIRYQSADLVPTTYQQRAMAVDDKVYITDDLRLRGVRVPGGYSYWVEDLSHINQTTRELAAVKEILEQDNDLVKSENDMKARRASAEEQLKLYTMLERNVLPQISKVDELIHRAPVDSAEFKENLARACVYKAYIKRLSNLILLGHDTGELNIFELENSIRESMDYLNLNGIETALICQGKGEYDVNRITLIYALFEAVVEENLEVMTHISVSISAPQRLGEGPRGENSKVENSEVENSKTENSEEAEKIMLRMRIEANQEEPDALHIPMEKISEVRETLKNIGGNLTILKEGVACLLESEMPIGGVELSGNGPLWQFK